MILAPWQALDSTDPLRVCVLDLLQYQALLNGGDTLGTGRDDDRTFSSPQLLQMFCSYCLHWNTLRNDRTYHTHQTHCLPCLVAPLYFCFETRRQNWGWGSHRNSRWEVQHISPWLRGEQHGVPSHWKPESSGFWAGETPFSEKGLSIATAATGGGGGALTIPSREEAIGGFFVQCHSRGKRMSGLPSCCWPGKIPLEVTTATERRNRKIHFPVPPHTTEGLEALLWPFGWMHVSYMWTFENFVFRAANMRFFLLEFSIWLLLPSHILTWDRGITCWLVSVALYFENSVDFRGWPRLSQDTKIFIKLTLFLLDIIAGFMYMSLAEIQFLYLDGPQPCFYWHA